MPKERSKQTISYADLAELSKVLLSEPNMDEYNHEDFSVVVRHHEQFLAAVASRTQRINAGALADIAKQIWQLKRTEADMFGSRLSKALAYCIKSGDNAWNGKKLAPEIVTVYKAFNLEKRKGCAQNELTKQHKYKARDPEEEGFKKFGSPPRRELPRRELQKALSSPSQIDALYAGVFSTRAKVIQCIHICMVCIYIYIYIYSYIYIHACQHKHPGGMCLLTAHIYIYIYIYKHMTSTNNQETYASSPYRVPTHRRHIARRLLYKLHCLFF